MVLTYGKQWSDKSDQLEDQLGKAQAFQAGKQAGTQEGVQKGAKAVMNQIKNRLAGNQKPGQSPGDDKTGDNRHDKDWPPPAPLKKASLNNNMMIAGGPSFDIGPGHGSAKKKAKGFNKTRNNPNDSEVKMIKKMLGGPELPDLQASVTSQQIRNRLKPFTRGGPADYDKEGGSLRGIPDSLRIQLLRDAKA